MAECDVVVVGAGPAGLTLAIQAAMLGANVRVLERRPGPRQWAPALAIHPRTMEILRGLGAADELLMRGLSRVGLQIHISGATSEGSLGELALPFTEYPFILFAPQPEVEAVLEERLSALGVSVEWGAEVVGIDQSELGVTARVADREGDCEFVVSRYLVGCDGAESTTREAERISFRGRSYRESILIADAAATGLKGGAAHAFLTGRGILFLFPLPTGRWRLIAPARSPGGSLGPALLVERHANPQVSIGDLDSVRVLRPQHRLASSYRKERVFLAGDAAHVHSPAGAQGMNTGIQDAANLGWKLALAIGGAPDSLLDSYETERRPVARQVVRLTGPAFALEVSDFLPLRWARRWAARPVASLLLNHHRLLSMVARVVSGLDTSYSRGALGDFSRVARAYRPGRRFPDAPIPGKPDSRLHDLIDASAFHLVIWSDQVDDSVLDALGTAHGELLRVHRLSRSRSPRGRPRVGYVLVRPDGYIAVSGNDPQLEHAKSFLQSWLGNQFKPTLHASKGNSDRR